MSEMIVKLNKDHVKLKDCEYVQDLVRCKECEHNPWLPDCDHKCIWDDDFADRPQTPEDFCSYGKRIDE